MFTTWTWMHCAKELVRPDAYFAACALRKPRVKAMCFPSTQCHGTGSSCQPKAQTGQLCAATGNNNTASVHMHHSTSLYIDRLNVNVLSIAPEHPSRKSSKCRQMRALCPASNDRTAPLAPVDYTGSW